MAIALAAAGAAAVVAVLLAGGGDEALVVVPNSLVRIDPETNEIAEVVPVGSWPDEVVAAGPYLFVTNIEDSTVSRLDTRSGVVRDFASVPHPRGLAAEDERTIWIGSNTEPEVARVDADTLAIERQILLEGLGAVWLAVGAGSLWVTHTPTGTASGFEPEPVSRVSLGSGQVEATFVTGLAPGQVAFGEGAAWVVNSGDSTVTRIDPGDGSLTQFGVGFTSYRVTTGLDAVWVPSEREAAVYRLSPATGRPRAIVPVGEIPWDVAASDDAVWATSHGSEGEAGGTLSRIDAETSRVVATIAVGQYPKGVAVTPDGVWVAVAGSAYPGRAGVPG
jgi:YVTN family beta-propeller protein